MQKFSIFKVMNAGLWSVNINLERMAAETGLPGQRLLRRRLVMGQNANYHLCIKGLLPYIEVIILRTNYYGTGEGCRCVREFSNFEVVVAFLILSLTCLWFAVGNNANYNLPLGTIKMI